MIDRSAIARYVEDLVASGQVTAAVAVVQSGDRPPARAAAGHLDPLGRRQPAAIDARFDLASLTKVLTGTLALLLDESGELRLDAAVGELWPEAADVLASVTLEDLLRHRAGFRRWMPLYATCAAPPEVPSRLLDGRWSDAPAPVYSDLDFILWGLTVERVLGAPLAELLRQRVLTPLGVDATPWSGAEASPLVSCLLPTGREVELAAAVGLGIDELPAPEPGQPQDGNCRFFGRPAGHAGLFASATDLLKLANAFLAPGGLLTPAAVERALGGADRFATGWFRRSETVAGAVLGERAFGHEGFTGGSLWVDPDSELIVVLLSHRRTLQVDLSEARTRFHRLALEL